MQEQKGFNIDNIVEELDAEFASEEAEVDPEDGLEAQDEEDTVEETEENSEDALDEEDEEDEDIEEDDDDEVHRRNEAFRKLREERDQYAQTDSFLEEIASEYGMTKQQLIDRWTEEAAARRAKREGIPPEQLKRQQELEKKVVELEQEKQREVFNLRTQALVERYSLTDEQVDQMFEQAADMGIDITTNPDLLEFVYKATNYDNAIEQGRQKQLETSKKRKKTATGKTGTKGAQVSETDSWDGEIERILREQNLIK